MPFELPLCATDGYNFFQNQVQHDHFEEFFAPELDKHGYQALYKRKTSEVPNFIFRIMFYLIFSPSSCCVGLVGHTSR